MRCRIRRRSVFARWATRSSSAWRRATDTRSSSKTASRLGRTIAGARIRRSASRNAGAEAERRELELPLLHLLEELGRFRVLGVLRTTGYVERRIIRPALQILRPLRLGDRFLHELGELLVVHVLDSVGVREVDLHKLFFRTGSKQTRRNS